MSSLHKISGLEAETEFPCDTLRRSLPTRIGKATWQIILSTVKGVMQSVEQANLAADRKRLRIQCERRHRSRT
jgi:hypothetical protein